jgi:putative integral membrane protein (TIGR02587 family)
MLSQSDAWRDELRGFVRAISGAWLFGVPLLYTMEMWWLGEISRPGNTLLVLLITFVANALLAGAACDADEPLFTKVEQAIRSVAAGIVAATVVLLILNQLTLETSPTAMVGMIAAQTLPLSIGAALGGIIFSGDRQGGKDGQGGTEEQQSKGDQQTADGSKSPTSFVPALLNDISATVIGAVFIAASVAPTEEVPMIAAGLDYPHLLALIGFTLLAGYIIVFASGFDPAAERDREHLFQHPATETVMAYVVALIVSFGALLLAHQVSFDDPIRYTLTQTLVLGLPAMIGGAAGRIAI